jgi:hypothetical protein
VLFHEIFLQEPVVEEAIAKIERTIRQVRRRGRMKSRKKEEE